MNICALISVDTGKVLTPKLFSSLIEKWKQIIEKKGYGAAIFMGLRPKLLMICQFDFKDKYTIHIPLVNTECELKGKNSIRYFDAVIWNAFQ